MKEEIKQLEKEIFSILDHPHENGEISWKEVIQQNLLKVNSKRKDFGR